MNATRRMLHRHQWAWVSVIVLLSLAATGAAGELPAELKQSLKTAADSMHTVAIEWTSKNTPALDRKVLAQIREWLGSNFLYADRSFSYRFDHGKFIYIANAPAPVFRGSEDTGELVPWTKSCSFDGTIIDVGTTDGVYARRSFERNLAEAPNSTFFVDHYWELAGWNAPATLKELSWLMHQKERAIIPEILYLSKNGFDLEGDISEESVGSAACWRLVMLGDSLRVTFWADPQIGFAVRQWERRERSTGALLGLCRLDNFERLEVAGGVWVPRTAELRLAEVDTVRSPNRDEVLLIEHATLGKIEFGKPLSADDLRLKYPPGTQVLDEVHPKAKDAPDGTLVYQSPADPRDLDAAIDRAIRERLAQSGGNGHFVWWMIAANVVAAALVLFVYWKRRRKA